MEETLGNLPMYGNDKYGKHRFPLVNICKGAAQTFGFTEHNGNIRSTETEVLRTLMK